MGIFSVIRSSVPRAEKSAIRGTVGFHYWPSGTIKRLNVHPQRSLASQKLGSRTSKKLDISPDRCPFIKKRRREEEDGNAEWIASWIPESGRWSGREHGSRANNFRDEWRRGKNSQMKRTCFARRCPRRYPRRSSAGGGNGSSREADSEDAAVCRKLDAAWAENDERWN